MAEGLTSVSCNHCGAPLQVPDTARFITCSYCASRLEVKRTASAIYTEVLQSIDQRTQQIAADVAQLKQQSELETLDREWQMRRETMLTHSKDGSVSEPSPIAGVVGCVIAVIFGIIWMAGAASAGAPGGFVLFGLVFIGAAIFGAISTISRAATYRDDEAEYRQRRQQIIQSFQNQNR